MTRMYIYLWLYDWMIVFYVCVCACVRDDDESVPGNVSLRFRMFLCPQGLNVSCSFKRCFTGEEESECNLPSSFWQNLNPISEQIRFGRTQTTGASERSSKRCNTKRGGKENVRHNNTVYSRNKEIQWRNKESICGRPGNLVMWTFWNCRKWMSLEKWKRPLNVTRSICTMEKTYLWMSVHECIDYSLMWISILFVHLFNSVSCILDTLWLYVNDSTWILLIFNVLLYFNVRRQLSTPQLQKPPPICPTAHSTCLYNFLLKGTIFYHSRCVRQ